MTVPKRQLFFLLCLFCCFLLQSCSAKNKSFGYSQFGDDSEYFLGLKSLQAGDYTEARRHFSTSRKKSSAYFSRLSAEALCSFGDVRERVEAAENLSSLFRDENSILTACRVFSENNEFNKIINLTKDKNPLEISNELEMYRLQAIEHRNDINPKDEIQMWILGRPFSEYHYKYLCSLSAGGLHEENRTLSFLYDLRSWVYKRDYNTAFYYTKESNLLNQLIEASELCKETYITEQVLSDLGKTYLYGSRDYVNNAVKFQTLAKNLEESGEKEKAFYCYFYCGRMYDKAGDYKNGAERCFKAAMESTQKPERRDNALWYLLKNSVRFSADYVVTVLEKNADKISDPAYFDDFFDTIPPMFLSEGNYSQLAKMYRLMDGCASKEALAKFSYIYGRILEEKIYVPESWELKGTKLEDEIKFAYLRALDSGSDMYYRIMAAKKLNLSETDLMIQYCTKKSDNEKNVNEDLERLLKGYAFFGFPEKIYKTWEETENNFMSLEGTISIASFLQSCSDKSSSDDYLNQSLRIASRFAFSSGKPLSIPLLKLVYPENYSDWVTEAGKKYGVGNSIMYALIRSESFYNPDVKSGAGAIGLCQLMPSTGEDIARRLKKPDFDLTDPETSIEFGTYYLSEMLRRLDYNYLDAFYAYNAGISRVRKWKKNAPVRFRADDLFLEILPFAETREYGRKLVSATEMYNWLYKTD